MLISHSNGCYEAALCILRQLRQVADPQPNGAGEMPNLVMTSSTLRQDPFADFQVRRTHTTVSLSHGFPMVEPRRCHPIDSRWTHVQTDNKQLMLLPEH